MASCLQLDPMWAGAQCAPMGVLLSPEQAAKRAGVSRRTIVRAVHLQELQASRDNRNRWRIDAERLDAWALPRLPTGQRLAIAQDAAQFEAERFTVMRERDELRVQLAGHLAELEGVRELLRAVEVDRDAWRELARQSWWQRLFGAPRGR